MTIEVRSFIRKSTRALFVLAALVLTINPSLANQEEENAVETDTSGGDEAVVAEVIDATAEDTGAEVAADPELIKAGKAIFNGNCKTCHAIGSVLVGPDLYEVTKRRDTEWLKAWITNPQKMIDSGDPTATELFAEYGEAGVMTAFPLTEDEFSQLFAYLATATPPAPETVVSSEATGGQVANKDDGPSLTLIIVLIILVINMIILYMMAKTVQSVLKEKKDLSAEDLEIVNQSHSIWKIIKNPSFIALASIFIFLWGFLFVVKDVLYNIGVQQGYRPGQPIAFSHKIHAGDNEIDCNYCHTGVRKSKHANIPSASICMNCHIKVKTESPEIAKIYEAIDYNPETKEFGTNVKPIRWKRVHNLPDLVYFNHSQHVKVGGLECEQCHGEVKEVGTIDYEDGTHGAMFQFAPLTMGWCIDCHRETAVNAKDNEYYDKLLEVHSKSGSKDPMTVEDIGGTECARCHY